MHPLVQHLGEDLLKSNLHWINCRAPEQEKACGAIARANELWVERALQWLKSVVKYRTSKVHCSGSLSTAGGGPSVQPALAAVEVRGYVSAACPMRKFVQQRWAISCLL